MYSRGKCQNINKAIPVTDWQSEGQTEVTLNVNIFSVHIFSILWNYLWKAIFLRYKPKYKQGYTHDWLTEWVTNWKHIKREHIILTNILYIIHFLWKAIFWGISQNINKVTPMTDGPSEWQTENTSNVNIFNIKIFFYRKLFL